MSWYYGLFLGIVQGLTEFLPVSSSGHLAIMEHLLGIDTTVPPFFDVLLHFGTLAAVFVVFWRDILDMLRAVPGLFRPAEKDTGKRDARRLILLLLIGTLPLGLALPLKDEIEALSDNMYVVGGALVLTAFLLYLASRTIRRLDGQAPRSAGHKDERTAKWTDALAVGAAQALAVTPGLSRSGTTLSMGLFSGFTKTFALRYAFLLSIPAVLGASLVELYGALREGVDPAILPACIVGVVTSAVVGVLSMGVLRRLASRLHIFAVYCLAAGLTAIIATAW